MACPYCDSERFTSDYVQAQSILANASNFVIQHEIGYNECADCGKWCKYTSTGDNDFYEAIENPEQRPSN